MFKFNECCSEDNNVAKVVISLLQEIQEMEQRATMLQLVEKFKVKKQESRYVISHLKISLSNVTFQHFHLLVLFGVMGQGELRFGPPSCEIIIQNVSDKKNI